MENFPLSGPEWSLDDHRGPTTSWEIVDVWWTDLRRIDEIVSELEFLIDRRRGSLLPPDGRSTTT